MFLASLTVVLWRESGRVSVRISNETGRQIEVEIIQAGNHSIHHRQAMKIANRHCQVFKLNTRTLERSIVLVVDEGGRKGKFRRPNGVWGFFQTESYTIDDDFLRDVDDLTGQVETPFQEPPTSGSH